MGRPGYGPKMYGPKWLWAEIVMGQIAYGPKDTEPIRTVITVVPKVDSKLFAPYGHFHILSSVLL